MSHKLYILDVSGFIFRAYFALPQMVNAQGESTHALFGFIRSVLKLFKEHDPKHIVAVFDGPDNKKQRREIYEEYKAHRIREYEDLPGQMQYAKQFCELIGIPHVELDGVEADDTMGSIAKWAEAQGYTTFLCTSDKDFCQLINDQIFVLNPWKENLIVDAQKVQQIYEVLPTQIIDLLALMGDASDNIPGIKGFGPKTAVQLLKEFGSLDNLLNNSDKVPGKKGATLKEQAHLARLSRQLATIRTDLEFEKDPHVFPRHKPAVAELKAFYLQHGFHSLVKELEATFAQPPSTSQRYHLVDDEASLTRLIEKLTHTKEIAFDVEATAIRPLVATAVGVGFCVEPEEAYYVPFNGKLGKKALEALKPLFANGSFYGHNAKYDAHVLANAGVHVNTLCFDTILASYILNSSTRRHSLDNLCLHYFGKVKIDIKSLIGAGKKQISMADVPLPKVCEYCCEDVDYTLRLKQILAPELHARQLDTLFFELELPLTRVLMKMERAGMFVDVPYLEGLGKEISHELTLLEKKIYTLAGEEFNINSPKQLSGILFEKMGIRPVKKTATGLSTSADVLEALADEHTIAKEILAYRSLEKLRSTYIETLPQEVNAKTKRVHPTFNQFIAATGRLACQDPNLQNIPVRSESGKRIREAFRPQKEGWSYLCADYSQIELRLLAHLSEDPTLIQAFLHGEDIHAYTASLMFEVPLQEVSATQRHQAKAINFGIVYGQQAFGLSRELGIDVHKAAAFIEAYYKRYPKVFEYMKHCIASARQTGKAITMTGRERDLPDIHNSNATIRAAAERLAVNTPLQGSAADLIKKAMLEIDRILEAEQLDSFMILQVHDELIFEAKDQEVPHLQKIVKKAMEGVFSLKVPLIVHMNVGKNWGQC